MKEFNRGDHSKRRLQTIPWETAERCASDTEEKTRREERKFLYSSLLESEAFNIGLGIKLSLLSPPSPRAAVAKLSSCHGWGTAADVLIRSQSLSPL
jgi:hypothetical protein